MAGGAESFEHETVGIDGEAGFLAGALIEPVVVGQQDVGDGAAGAADRVPVSVAAPVEPRGAGAFTVVMAPVSMSRLRLR